MKPKIQICPPAIQHYLWIGEQSEGPFTSQAIRDMLGTGEVDLATPCRSESMEEWRALGELPEIIQEPVVEGPKFAVAPRHQFFRARPSGPAEPKTNGWRLAAIVCLMFGVMITAHGLTMEIGVEGVVNFGRMNERIITVILGFGLVFSGLGCVWLARGK